MKQYDRETRKYVEEAEIKRKLKKRELCRGGKEHDYILTLPPYIHTETSVLGIDVAERYYEIERERDELNEAQDIKLAELGIKGRRGFSSRTKYYICAVCKKNKYESAKNV